MRPGIGAADATAADDAADVAVRPYHQSLVDAYLELVKARLSGLVVITTLVGFLLADPGPIRWMALFWTLLGTSLIVGGANAFNQVIEVERDRRMTRTRNRPLPSGRLSRRHGFVFSMASSGAGLGILTVMANPLTGLLAFIAFAVYVAVYTPLKTRSTLCTLVGAVSGAIPPMMGWTASAGRLDLGAWLLFTLLFVWQIPHFLALAWMCREDYERGGYVMLPLIDPSGRATCRLVLLYSLLMLPVGIAFPLAGLAGWVYTLGSIALGAGMLALGVVLYRERTALNARRVFLASVIYLPLLLGLMLADRSSFPRGVVEGVQVRPAAAVESETPSIPTAQSTNRHLSASVSVSKCEPASVSKCEPVSVSKCAPASVSASVLMSVSSSVSVRPERARDTLRVHGTGSV